MPARVRGLCSYSNHADLITALRSEGKFGEAYCSQCGGILQIGARRCKHGSLINERGQNLCELCRAPHSDASGVHHVSQSQVDSFLRDMPAIADSELRADEQQSSETESIADTNLMDGMEN